MGLKNKNYTIFLFVIMLFFISCSALPREDRIVYQLIRETRHYAKEKYGLTGSGLIERNDRKNLRLYREIGLLFQIDRRVEKEEGRRILFDIQQNLINKINTNEEIRSIFSQWPITNDTISVSIFVYPAKDEEACSLNIMVFELDRDVTFSYKILNEESKYFEENESLEEARNLNINR